MFYITGDTHGVFDRVEEFCDVNGTTKEDTLIILGDAGINYYLDESDVVLKESLSQLPITLFCIHGNHEERPELTGEYEEEKWNEGDVFVERDYPNILFAKDGEVYNLNGMKAIAIGGAYSVDKYFRINTGQPWFPSEQPDDWIKERVESKLTNVNWEVDYVLSHTGPQIYLPTDTFLPNIDQDSVDTSTEEWLSKIEEKLSYDTWYFGHFHIDRNEDRAIILFKEILELGDWM